MTKVICIKKCNGCFTSEEIGDTLYLDKFTIFGDSNGDWYGKMYKKNEDGKFVRVGFLLLSRFKSV